MSRNEDGVYNWGKKPEMREGYAGSLRCWQVLADLSGGYGLCKYSLFSCHIDTFVLCTSQYAYNILQVKTCKPA